MGPVPWQQQSRRVTLLADLPSKSTRCSQLLASAWVAAWRHWTNTAGMMLRSSIGGSGTSIRAC